MSGNAQFNVPNGDTRFGTADATITITDNVQINANALFGIYGGNETLTMPNQASVHGGYRRWGYSGANTTATLGTIDGTTP